MANVKISNFNTVTDGQGSKPDVRNLSAIAGVEGAGNAKISGAQLVSSVINSNNSGAASAVPHRVTFYNANGESLAGSENFSWDNNTATLSVNNLSGGPVVGRLNLTHEKIEQLNDSGLTIESDKNVTITGGNGAGQGINLFTTGGGTDGYTQYFDPFTNGQSISIAPGSNGSLLLNTEVGKLEFNNSMASLASISGSDLELKVGSNSDDLRVYLGSTGPSVGDVLAVDSLDGNTGIMKWSTPASGTSAFTNLTAGDVVEWDYAVDGPNIELITVQDPNPAITQDNVITMYSGGTVSDISDIPDGATGTLIVHPTANPYFNFPTGSKISDASNIRLDGATKVLRWIKEGPGADPTLSPTNPNYGCLYWAGFENFANASVIPGPDIDPAITSNLYGWWDPDDYTAAVLGSTGTNLGVINNSTVPSKTLGGASTGNSLTINNSMASNVDAWQQIELIDSANSNPTHFKWTSTSYPNYAFDNSTINPAQDKYTFMAWFRVDSAQPDTSDLGIFDASITGTTSSEDSGYQLDNISSNSSRVFEFRTRSSSPNIFESKYQNWANDEWCCVIVSVDPSVPQIRHLIGNQYTSTNAGSNISGSGIVSDSDTIAVNADGTYIDFLYDGGNLTLPSNASNLTSSEIIEQFTGFRFGEGRRPDFSSFDFQGDFGVLALWSGEAKSDSDMQTIYDYLKGYFGIT